jgi:serine protease Do
MGKKDVMKRYQLSIILALLISLALSGCGPVFTMLAMPERVREAEQPQVVEAVALEAALIATPEMESSLVQAAQAEQMNTAALAMQGTFERIYEQVNPSVVNIQVRLGGSGGSFSGSQGSGFVYDNQGHIITNNHVVDGARQITVTFADGTTVEADLVGKDPNSDLAVIKVNLPAEQLRPLALADSSLVKVGQMAIAIGNPFGLSGTMTTGIVSALSRSLPVEAETLTTGGSYTIPDIIQTDAAINPGNSGGVLVNIDGELIGVPTAIRTTSSGNSGIGFVVPSNIVRRVVPSLIETGKYDHPRIGISGFTLTSEIADAMGLGAGQKGILVTTVISGGPGEKAGLRGTTASGQSAPDGDVIIAIDGLQVTKFDDLTSYLFNNTQVGQTVTLTILRQGQERTVELTLGVLSAP